MTKQEFLAFSLPYGLKMCYAYKDRIDIHILLPMHFDFKFQLVNERGKPILHPLSDLTKPIEHNGEKFVPIDNIEGLFIEGTEDLINQSIEAIEYFIENNFFSRMEYLPFILIQKLIEWKFDLFGGIDSGEAIDVNTLPENPYK